MVRGVLVGAVVLLVSTVGVVVVRTGHRATRAEADAAQPAIVATSTVARATDAAAATTSTTVRPFAPRSLVAGGLSVVLKTDGGLFYPPRGSDTPAIGAAQALHSRDGGGNPFDPSLRHPGVPPVILLARFTDVISVATRERVVDVLVWLVIFNNVTLDVQKADVQGAPGRVAPEEFLGYDLTVVDAHTREALREYEASPPFSAAQLGL